LAAPIVGGDAVSNVTARAAAVGVMATGEAEAEGGDGGCGLLWSRGKVGDGELLYRGFMWAQSLRSPACFATALGSSSRFRFLLTFPKYLSL
jgi:hypothetical protein